MVNYLSLSESILMLAINQMEDNAYGVTIREKILDLTGKEYSYGTLYSSLDQLVKKQYLTKIEGNPTPERGGRRKIFYSLTTEGMKILKLTWKLHNSLWGSLSENSFNK